MRQAFLKRIKSSNLDHGTPGIFTSDKGFTCRTLELPWKDNESNISCIPAGTYLCTYRYSKKYSRHYLLHNVDGRTYILTHSGNLAGDVSKGLKTHSHGCILVGKYHGSIKKQFAVLCSKPTLRRLVDHFEKQSFELEIKNYLPCNA